jgi:hypothetical protein
MESENAQEYKVVDFAFNGNVPLLRRPFGNLSDDAVVSDLADKACNDPG